MLIGHLASYPNPPPQKMMYIYSSVKGQCWPTGNTDKWVGNDTFYSVTTVIFLSKYPYFHVYFFLTHKCPPNIVSLSCQQHPMDVNCIGRSSVAASLIWILGILRPGVGLKLFVTDSGPNIEGPRKLWIELFDYSDGKKLLPLSPCLNLY